MTHHIWNMWMPFSAFRAAGRLRTLTMVSCLSAASKSVGANHKSLKDQNRTPLIAVLGLNFVVFIVAVKTGHLLMPSTEAFVQQWSDFLTAEASVVLVGVVNGLLSADTKARLVFWRWDNPLPGSFAFSRYAELDSRIDVPALRKAVGSWPSEPREQNAQWYRLYKSVESEPAVTDAHRHFLLTRDYAAVAFLLIPTLGLLGILLITSLASAGAYIAILAMQYLFVRQAAYNYGIRFVTTVMALKAAR